MADTFTAGYNLTKPEVGQSRDTWGTKLNADLDVIDTALGTFTKTDGTRAFTAPIVGVEGTLDTQLATRGYVKSNPNGALKVANNLSDLADLPTAKTTLGINNVNNTSDANKPVSTAQQTALDLKLDKTGGTISNTLTVQGTGGVTAPQVIVGTRAFAMSGANVVLKNAAGTVNTLTIDDSGNLTAAANVTAYSDASLKEGVATLNGAIELVRRLRGVAYRRIETGAHEVGVIAQEVRDVLPEVVLENANGLLSVNYGALVAPLIEAVKDLVVRIEALEAR